MTTPDDVETVARAMYGAWHDAAARPWEDQADDVRRDYREAAPAVLAALADRLMPEGGETARRWRVVYTTRQRRGHKFVWLQAWSKEEAEQGQRDARRHYPDAWVQTRTVYATPWTPEGTDG